jgi:hypothetical protein
MEREKISLVSRTREGVCSWIVPNIAAVSSVTAQLNIVPMRAVAVLENQHQFMLAAVERSHAGIVFGPNAYIFQLVVDLFACREQLSNVSPVHANEMQGASLAVLRQELAGLRQELSELGLVHLARGHDEVTVVHFSQSGGVACDGDVVGWIREDAIRALSVHEGAVALRM